MAEETPKHCADLSQPQTGKSQPEALEDNSLTRPSVSPPGETARAADSVPFAGEPFTALPIQFGKYQIQREIGRGQMGAVYLAMDTELDRCVALKVARASASGNTRQLQRLASEAKSAAKVDHPLICKVYDAGVIAGIPFISLQYVEGEDLKKYLRRMGRKRDPEEAVSFIVQILKAVEAAHENGVVHRDLKPENIILNKRNEPVITDFGLARRTMTSADASLKQGMIIGTAGYMSPEQASGNSEDVDHRTDLYAIGVMFFEMLTGEWPFTGSALEVMGKKCVQEPPSPLKLVSDLNPSLAAVCGKMIARRKEDRFANCSEILTALTSIDEIAIPQPGPTVEPAPDFDVLAEFPATPTIDRRSTKAGKKKRRAQLNSRTSESSYNASNFFIKLRHQPKEPSWRRNILLGIGSLALMVATILVFNSSPQTARDNSNRKVTNTPQDRGKTVFDGKPSGSKPAEDPKPSSTQLGHPEVAEKGAVVSYFGGQHDPLNQSRPAPNGLDQGTNLANYIKAMHQAGQAPPINQSRVAPTSTNQEKINKPASEVIQLFRSKQQKLELFYPRSKLLEPKTKRFEKESPSRGLNQLYIEKGVMGIRSHSGEFAWNFEEIKVNQMIRAKLRVCNHATGKVGLCFTQNGNLNGAMIHMTGDRRAMFSPSPFANEKPTRFQRAYDLPDILNPVDEWNELACVLKSDALSVYINGAHIDDLNLTTPRSTSVTLSFVINSSSTDTVVEMDQYTIYRVK